MHTQLIEKMEATPEIDANVEIKIPRSAFPYDETKHKYKCSCCGKGFARQNGYFQKSNDVLFQANNGYLPWCKECTDKYVTQMTALYSNNEELAMKDFCQRAGWNYDLTALVASRETYSGHRDRSRISHYSAKKNLNCDGRKTYIDTLKYDYENKQNEIVTSKEQAINQGFEWNIIFKYDIKKTVEDKSIKLEVDNEDLIGSSILLQVIIDGKVMSEKKIKVIVGVRW